LKSVAVVVGDIGSAIELVPAVTELARRGADVKWFVDPEGKAGTNVLVPRGITYESRLPNGDDTFSLVLVGASVTAYEYQIEWTRWGRSCGARVMWYEDLHTTAARPAVRVVSPHVMLVIDEVALRITNETRPELADVCVVGKPSFEDLPGMMGDASAIRKRVRADLEIGERDFLVAYWSAGEAPEQTRAHLGALRNLNTIEGRRVVFAPRLHPKLPDFVPLWAYATTGSCLTVDARQINPAEHLSLAADLVVAAWQGTNGLRAALLGKYVAIPFFPEDTDHRIAAGHLEEGRVPLMRAKIALPINSAGELPGVISRVMRDPPELRQHIRERTMADFGGLLQPGAVKRIADAVEGESPFIPR